MSHWHTIVVGGGAAGLMAASYINHEISRWGVSPFLVEGGSKLGRKLLATGNGRCNLTNLAITPEHYHGDPLAARVLEQYPPERILAEFEELGLLCRADSEGRVYPRGNQASAVLRLLSSKLGAWTCNKEVVAVRRALDDMYQQPCFEVESADGDVDHCTNLILACGGKASPKHSTGSGYELARSLGHTVTGLSPSLVPLKTTSKVCKELKGMRAKARATLYQNGKPVYAESGEVIFGDGKISGICVFNLSARLRETGTEGLEVGLDLLEDMELSEVIAYLHRLRENYRVRLWASRDLFSGVMNLEIGQQVVHAAGIPWDDRMHRLTDVQLENAARLAKDWRFPVTGPGSWEEAQITAGGVPLSEVNLTTMQSKLVPHLYLIGELLDVDGDCGGYNLHWAWATALAAAQATAHL